MTIDFTSLLGVLPVTSREITRDETSISWRKVKLRLSVSRSNAPSPESVHEDLPDYEDAPEAGSHANDRGGAEDEDESEEDDQLEEDDKVASDTDYSNPLPDSPPQHLPSALGLDFTSPIDLTQDDQQARVLSQLASIDLRDSTDEDSSCETRLREAEAFIASAVLHTQSPAPIPSPPQPADEPLHEHDIQSTRMIVRRVGRYETIYTLSHLDPDSDDDDEGYFEVSRPGIARWSSTPTHTPIATSTKTAKTRPVHRELSLHPRLPSFLSIIPRYHRTYSSTWFRKNDRVKRVLEARERRHASNPAVGRGGEFVKKAVERFGPSWRVKVPSVFDRVLKKTASDPAVTVDVVSNNERMRTGSDINRPANVPRIVDPRPTSSTGLTVPLFMDGYKPEEASLSIQSDLSMVVPDEVPECIVVPSTPPPPPPRSTPLPYLTSHSSTSQLDYPYPYIPTPPLDPISLPTPRLTREASFASENSSFVPTPESGRLALPALPTLGVPEVLGAMSVKYGSPSADGASYPYIATPPLPTLPLAPTPAPIVPPSLPLSSLPFPFTPLQPITPPSPTLTLPTAVPKQPPPPLTTVLPSFPVGQPPPPLQPLQPPAPIIPPPPTLTLPTLPTTTAAQPQPPLTTILPSFPVGQLPPPLPPLIPPLVPPLVPSLSVPVPLEVAGTGYMRSSQPPSSGFFQRLESQMVMQPPLLSSEGSGSGLAPQSFMPPAGPTLPSITTAPTLHLQIPPPSRITESAAPSESMDCREDAYAPLITMTSPVEQPCIPIPEFVMGDTDVVVGQEVPVRQIHAESLDGEVVQQVVADVGTARPSYQGALDSGYASDKEGKGKHRATDEDGLDGDLPPFDESDPLWEELLAYKADPHGDGLGSSSCVDPAGLGQEVAEFLGGDPAGAFDLDSSNTSWDFSAVLDPADSNPPDQPESEDAVWKELCAWADEQPPEMLESVFGMLDTSVADESSVEPVGFGEFPPLDESQPLELPVPTITVESVDPSSFESYSQSQFAQDAIYSDGTKEARDKYSNELEASPSFTLDELDWAVIEQYAQLEDLECPSSSVDAARVMVIAIRAVAAKAKSNGQAFVPVVDFPSVYPSIVAVQSVSPSYEYASLLDEDAQVPPVNSHYYQPSLPSTSLAHALAAS